MTENTLHWLAVAVIVITATAAAYMWFQQLRASEMEPPAETQANQPIN